MLTQTQIEERRHGIGGSDIGAICNLSPYKTPVEVYLSKMEPEPYAPSPQAHWGSQIEPLLAQDYALRHQVALDHPPQRSHAVYAWALLCNDGEVTTGVDPLTVDAAVLASNE